MAYRSRNYSRSNRSRSYGRGVRRKTGRKSHSRAGRSRAYSRTRDIRLVIEQPAAPAVTAADYMGGNVGVSTKAQRSTF